MKAPWKLPLALVVATASITGFFYFATQEPQFEFVSQLDGKMLDNPLKGDWKVLNESKRPRVFYGFRQTEEEVFAAMRRELKPPRWTMPDDLALVDEKTGILLMLIRMPARDMPDGIRTIVDISRGPNIVESIRWKLFGTPP